MPRWSALLALAVSVATCGPPGSRAPDTELSTARSPSNTASLRLHGDLDMGDHAVGFRKERLDLALPGEDAPSAVDLYLWFPATGAGEDSESSPPLTLADYYEAQEPSAVDRAQLGEWLLEDMTSPPGLDVAALEPVLAAPMWARRGLAPAPGSHPLVLWSYRDSIPTMQAGLNEYLASHGYVVAFPWPVDNQPPLPWEGELTRDDKLRSLEVQVAMLGATLDSLLARSWVESGKAAVLAWSYGGESAAGLQRQRPEIRLALGIDGTLVSGWIFAPADDLEALDPRELTATYALLKNGRPRIDVPESAEPPLLAEVPAGAWYVRFPALSHGNFNFPGGMLPGVLGLEEVSSWAVGGETARLGYELICRHALGLLDLHLGDQPGDPAAWAAAAPDGFVEVVRHRPR